MKEYYQLPWFLVWGILKAIEIFSHSSRSCRRLARCGKAYDDLAYALQIRNGELTAQKLWHPIHIKLFNLQCILLHSSSDAQLSGQHSAQLAYSRRERCSRSVLKRETVISSSSGELHQALQKQSLIVRRSVLKGMQGASNTAYHEREIVIDCTPQRFN